MGNPRKGTCLCGEPATISDTKAADGRLHFMCSDLTPDGKSKHYGFVDRSEAERLEVIEYDGELWVPDEETAGEVRRSTDRFGFRKITTGNRFGFPTYD